MEALTTGGDLRTQQFARVLSAFPEETTPPVPTTVKCQRLLGAVGTSGPIARAALVGAATVCVLLLVRPPFVLAFEYDKTRPWKGRSHISWLSIALVAVLASCAAAFVPMLCR